MADKDYIVCGWYTPDYRPWADRLRFNLDKLGEPYAFTEVKPIAGGWERNTLRKPGFIRDAMSDHPDKTIIFLDVDCQVFAPLNELAAIRGDVGLYMREWRSRRAAVYLSPRSGTMVFKPNWSARHFVNFWWIMSTERYAAHGAVDQHTLSHALATSPNLTVTQLANKWCAVAADSVENPCILHDSASKAHKKIPKWRRRVHAWLHERY